MIFASEELAARVERAEADLMATAAGRLAGAGPSGRATFVEALGGGAAVFTAVGSPLNKVAGVGFAGPLDEAALATVEAAYAKRDCPVRFEVSTLADPTVVGTLTRRGYLLVGFENVLGRALGSGAEDEAAVVVVDDLSIERVGPEDLDVWLHVVSSGFATPDPRGVVSDESFPPEVLEPILRDFALTEGMATYLAHRDGEPAGGASMRLAHGVALLCGAATLPRHRRRGVQATLLAHRLADAARAGCDLAVVTTQPGSTSQQNVQRKGFELLYARAVLVREPAGG